MTCVCQIYPSEFGKERMSAEQTQGPLELTGLPENPDTDTEEQRYCFHDLPGFGPRFAVRVIPECIANQLSEENLF